MLFYRFIWSLSFTNQQFFLFYFIFTFLLVYFLIVLQNAAAFTDNTFFCSESWDASPLMMIDMSGTAITDYTCGDNRLRTISLGYAVLQWFGGVREDNYINPRGTYTGQTFAAYNFATNPDETLTVIVDGTDVDITLSTDISNTDGAILAISNGLCPNSPDCVNTVCITSTS